MQRDMLTEFHSIDSELKHLQNITIKKFSEPNHALQENYELLKNCAIKSLPDKSETPSMVSELAESNPLLSLSIKDINTFSKHFDLKDRLTLGEESVKSGGKVLNVSEIQIPKKPSQGGSVNHLVLSTGNSNSANNAAKIRSFSVQSRSSTDFFNDICPDIKPNDFRKKKTPFTVVVIEPRRKTQVRLELDADFNKGSGSDPLLLNTTAKLHKFPSKNSSNQLIKSANQIAQIKEPEVVTERIGDDPHVSSQNEPVCMMSEVIGNTDIFSKTLTSDENSTSGKPPHGKYKPTDATALEASGRQGMLEDGLGNFKVIDVKIEPAFSDLKVHIKDTTGVLATDAIPSSERKNADADNFANNDADLRETSKDTSRGNTNKESSDTFLDTASIQEITVISEKTSKDTSLGNTNKESSDTSLDTASIQEITVISETETVTPEKTQSESIFPDAENPEIQLIMPKKTNDITKIKGWRRKQFLVEKPTSVEFYKLKKGTRPNKIKVKSHEKLVEEAGNVKNAFVCDSLDEFLDQKVKLKVGYEIPHLYAEVGIKLTREDLASKPNLSAKDLKEVGSRYCIPVQEKNNIVDLDEIDEKIYKSGKRHVEDDPKPLKFLKLQNSKRLSILQKHALKIIGEKKEIVLFEGMQERLKENGASPSVFSSLSRYTEKVENIKLESKLLGLVVYPGPFQPLHSIVQYHIEKLRSYSTRIDKNWANFAASAVLTNDKHYKRRILPVRCCVKIEECVQNLSEGDSLVKNKLLTGAEDPKSTKYSKEIKLKECQVVVDKINFAESLSPWCMEHETYDCEPCGLSKTKSQNFKSLKPCKQEMSKDEKSIASPRATFDAKIANLLTRKLRFLNIKEDTATGIECLKKLVPNTIELIKLNFVKESFLNARISIWFLKQESASSRSRAFLTFSETPPVRNAVNLRFYSRAVMKNLPKVITEIVSSDNIFSPNEYAILHCDGQIWEIHGSLNIAIKKYNRKVEQIFASTEMPELKPLRETAEKILNVKAAKWWVMDLSQYFKLIELEFGSTVTIMSRNIFLENTRSNARGFIPIRGNSRGRLLGVYILRPLLPFVLMGPYFLLEPHNLTLKGERSTLPFRYFLGENVMKNPPLKYFINSAIKDVEENGRVLEGLWLYDKMCLDGTSYLEVLTRNSESPNLRKFASIDIDHGYSLSSLTNSKNNWHLSRRITTGAIKRNDGQDELKKVTVYLYFDVFELGYVEGELQRDNSVIICHPLHRQTKVKSLKVGDWFVRTIKRRLEFVPKDLEVKWFITKHKEDLRERRPFNKFHLSGAHVLTKDGIFYLLELSESKIAELGLEKNEIVRAIKESRIIKMVLEMKKLAKLLYRNPEENSSMVKVLTKAISETEKLKSMGEYLRLEKLKSEEQKLWLLYRFFRTLKSCQVNDHFKLKKIEDIEHMFIKEDGECRKEFMRGLKYLGIDRQYLKRFRRCSPLVEKARNTNQDDAHSRILMSPRMAFKKLESLLSSFNQLDISRVESRVLKSPVRKTQSPDIVKAKEDLPKFPRSLLKQRTVVNPISVQIGATKNKSSGKVHPTQDFQGGNNVMKKVKLNEIVALDAKNISVVKGNAFLKLTSRLKRLPENIKFDWKMQKS